MWFGHTLGRKQAKDGYTYRCTVIMLTSAQPSFTIVKQGPEQHLLISVCVHGNETCGLLAYNELLQASPSLISKPPCPRVCYERWLMLELVSCAQCT